MIRARHLITISRARSYRACPRYHDLSYNQLVSPIDDAETAAFGTAGHAGLEAWLLAVQAGCDAETAIGDAQLHASVSGRRLGLDAFELERLAAVLDGYHLRWWGAPYMVLAVEQQFRVPLFAPDGEPSALDQGGKMDAVVQDQRDGRVLVQEHKFTEQDVSPGSPYWIRLRIDGQVSIYIDGAASFGYDVAGCLYDVISKPGLKPLRATPVEEREYTKAKGCKECGGKVAAGVQGRGAVDGAPCAHCGGTGWSEPSRLYARFREADETPAEFGDRCRAAIAENPEKFYQRAPIVRFGSELDTARADLWSTAAQIEWSRRTGSHPRNDSACAFMYGRPCSFLPVCTGEASVHDSTRYRIRDSAHPELQPSELERGATQP